MSAHPSVEVAPSLSIKLFAKEFARSAREGGVYSMREIVSLIGLPASDHVQPDQLDDVIAFGHAFADLKGAMIDTVPAHAPLRRTAVIVEQTSSIDLRENTSGLSHSANGLFVSHGIVAGNVKKYDARLQRSGIQTTPEYTQAFQRALINAAVSEGVPVIIPAHTMENEGMEIMMRLQAYGYDVVHRETLEPVSAPSRDNT